MPAFTPFLKPIAATALPAPVPDALATHRPFQVVTPQGETGLFTGYFEPTLRGAPTRHGAFQHPIYAPPPDLLAVPNLPAYHQPGITAYGRMGGDGTLQPHASRAEIEAGALAGCGQVLLFVDDAVDLFFAHIQGSACVQLADGSQCRIGFAAKNGHAYTPIGRVLREKGWLTPPITMQHIKGWLRHHSGQAAWLMQHNQSYIFFKISHQSGPVGASGAVLRPEQSLAIDDTIWPYGLNMLLATHDPLLPHQPFIRWLKTADTGSAIRGALRGDVYFGSGAAAGEKAGAMQAQGQLFVLLP